MIKPYYEENGIVIYQGDCLDILPTLEANSIDSIVTDPPYGLSFMGKKWDYDVPSVDVWRECLRVLKPGGHLLSFAGTRTQHRMAVNIEDAGFEIRDMIAWVYGSGFPKSLNVGKAVDKLQGNEREISGYEERFGREGRKANCGFKEEYVGASGTQDQSAMKPIMLPVSEEAKQWEGWGTALKPALEPITVARKPLEKGLTVAENCLKWGVGGINIDGCRVKIGDEKIPRLNIAYERKGDNNFGGGKDKRQGTITGDESSGRFPANLIHDGSQEVLELFPNTGQPCGSMKKTTHKDGMFGIGQPGQIYTNQDGDNRSAARFFYCAKASKAERNRGCEGLEEKIQNNTETNSRTFNDRCLTCKKKFVGSDNTICHCPPELKITDKTIYTNKNNHPTIKPIALMEYLVKLVTREGQTVLDPFAGSGTTGIACKNLNRNAILIEREGDYIEIAGRRISAVQPLFEGG